MSMRERRVGTLAEKLAALVKNRPSPIKLKDTSHEITILIDRKPVSFSVQMLLDLCVGYKKRGERIQELENEVQDLQEKLCAAAPSMGAH